jgi:bifunctional non-homologous end joining protein LigD
MNAKLKPQASQDIFAPQLATLVDEVPKGEGWIFEMKLDGYRAVAIARGRRVRLLSRNGNDWAPRFPSIAAAVGKLRAKEVVLDGEVCFVDDDGKTSFQRLQNALSTKNAERLTYFVFDLLSLDGKDLRPLPLATRKRLLAELLGNAPLPLRLCDHLTGDGSAFFREACLHGLEGIIAKRADTPYVAGRSRSWLKIKCGARQELVIIGFTAPKGSRSGIGALVLGVRDDAAGSELRFAGKVGTGFSAQSLVELHRKLAPLARATPAAANAPRMRDVTWVEPKLVCEVRFSEWTDGGALRHPTFMGLREDKQAKSVVRERPKPMRASARARADSPG